jgi:hypothetical protein
MARFEPRPQTEAGDPLGDRVERRQGFLLSPTAARAPVKRLPGSRRVPPRNRPIRLAGEHQKAVPNARHAALNPEGRTRSWAEGGARRAGGGQRHEPYRLPLHPTGAGRDLTCTRRQPPRYGTSMPRSGGIHPINVVEIAIGLRVTTAQAGLGGSYRVWLAGAGLSISTMASTPVQQCCICHSSVASSRTAPIRRTIFQQPANAEVRRHPPQH